MGRPSMDEMKKKTSKVLGPSQYILALEELWTREFLTTD